MPHLPQIDAYQKVYAWAKVLMADGAPPADVLHLVENSRLDTFGREQVTEPYSNL